MVRGPRIEHRFKMAEPAVRPFPVGHVPRHRSGTYREMPADFRVLLTRFAGNDRFRFAGLRILDPFQAAGQRFIKPAMYFPNGSLRRRTLRQSALINPALHRDMSNCLLLKIASFGSVLSCPNSARWISIGCVLCPSMRLE